MTLPILPSAAAEVDIHRRVFRGPLRDFLHSLLDVGVEDERAAVRQERHGAHVRLDQLQAVTFKLHVAHDIGAQRAGGMRERGTAKAGMKFLRDGGAADLRAALEYERLESGLGQIKCGDQTVVAATDDDDVARLRPSVYAAFPSFRISSAARRPGAPMMPPPGCVADPHM